MALKFTAAVAVAADRVRQGGREEMQAIQAAAQMGWLGLMGMPNQALQPLCRLNNAAATAARAPQEQRVRKRLPMPPLTAFPSSLVTAATAVMGIVKNQGEIDDPSGNGGAGGAGGSASLTLTGATVTSTGTVLVQSGENGEVGDGNGRAPDDTEPQGKNGAGGAGGTASFTANALIAPDITLTKNDGALTFNLNTLDVTTGNTTLTLSGSPSATIGTVELSGGNTFIVSGGTAAITTLEATGKSKTISVPATQAFTNVNFTLTSDITNNDIMLTSANAINLSGVTVAWRWTHRPPHWRVAM